MYRSSRIVLQAKTTTTSPSSSSQSAPFLFRPPVLSRRKFDEILWSGIQGLWSLTWSEEQRQAYLDLAHPGWSSGRNEQQPKNAEADQAALVINYPVLAQARYGSLLTAGLFQEIQNNPLWKECQYEPVEFLQGVIPALEYFHSVVGHLENQFPQSNTMNHQEDQEQILSQLVQLQTRRSDMNINNNRDADDDDSTDNDASSSYPVLFAQSWVTEGQKDPQSYAGQLMKMVVPNVMDLIFMSSRLSSMMFRHVEGSIKVQHAALLSVKAVAMDIIENEKVQESPSYNGIDYDDDENNKIPDHVVAQMEVLYTVEQRRSPQTELLEQIENESNSNEEHKEFLRMAKEEIAKAPERQEFFFIGTFEGWIKGGPTISSTTTTTSTAAAVSSSKSDLQWRITDLRYPDEEFPDMIRPL